MRALYVSLMLSFGQNFPVLWPAVLPGGRLQEEKAQFVRIFAATDPQDMSDLEEIQAQVWGDGVVPLHQLIAAIRNGGCVLVAKEAGRTLGFCYGFSGGGHLVSHLLAVREEARGRGLGRRLKLAQRDWARAQGYQEMRWTFDPFRLGNAHFNLRVLGAVGVAYHQDYYGEMVDELNPGDSDRLEMAWSTREISRPSSEKFVDVTAAGDLGQLEEHWGLRLPLPKEYGLARRNRRELRSQFDRAFAAGYKLVDFRDHAYLFLRATRF